VLCLGSDHTLDGPNEGLIALIVVRKSWIATSPGVECGKSLIALIVVRKSWIATSPGVELMWQVIIPILRQSHRLEPGIYLLAMTPPLRSNGLGCGIQIVYDPLEAIKHGLA
jgi:hypothetical protein